MGFDEEKAVPHGAPQEIFEDQTPRPQRPLTAAEKLEATRIDINPRRSSSEGDSSAPEWQEVQEERGILARLRAFEALMDRKLGVESEAIVRKLPEERQPVSWAAKLSMFCLWASGTMNLSCFATGFLGWKFGLTLTQSILIIVFASLLGGAVSGFCATMGPQTGLRQISIGRFSMGWYPNKIVALLNTIQQIGWSSVGCITGGLALTAVSDGSISIAVGIVVIAVCSTTISVVGLRAILVYERYAWLVYLVIFLVIYGQTGRYANDAVMDESARITGATLSGTILSLFAIVYGSSASWATIASDYYAHYPVKENRTKIFIMTALGIALPTSFAMVAGAVVASTLNTRIDLAQVYGEQGLGFLVQEMLYPLGFAKLILVLLVLSGINMNIINTYSAAISCQQFARPCAQVPRFLWTLLCFGVIIALALAGRNDLLTYLENFLALLGYWCTSYFVIVFTEHYLFRRADFGNYDLDGWNDPARLPRGYAAFAAFSLGVIAWVMGMVQSWYVGPLGGLIGDFGGDVANQMTFVVTLSTYIPARYFELSYLGR